MGTFNLNDVITLRIDDACRVAGLGRTSLYKLIGEGRLKSVTIGGRRLVVAASLRELLENGTPGVPVINTRRVG